MKRFLSSVAFCFTLLLTGLFVFLPSSEAQGNLLVNLLNLPAPPPPNPLMPVTSSERNENFFSKKNPPKDDAPIEDLLDYWRNQNQFDPKYGYTIKPSEKSLDRLLAEIEKKPELLTGFLKVLPASDATADFVKRLYDEELSARNHERAWRSEVKGWLTYHTNFFSDELLQTARQAADSEGYVTNQDEVLALARVDWEKARPLLEKMLGNADQPISQTLARWAFYKHALKVNDTSDIEKYRQELQEVVENKNLQPGNRDLAMDAVVESGDFPGRDEWYLSLLEDESLFELRVNGQLYTGLTTILNHSPPEKYVEKMIELVGSNNPTVRNAAIRNLTTLLDDVKNPEIARALLPWLENPKWAKEADGERRKLVSVLRNHTIPESVPGLIAILNEKESKEVYLPTNANSNVAVYSSNRSSNLMVNGNVNRMPVDYYPYRSAAITALEKQKDFRAVPALRQILPQVEGWERQNVVKALLASNGFSITEQVEALETVAKSYQQMEATRSSYTNTVSNTANSEESVEMEPPVVAFVTANTVVQSSNTAAFPYNPFEIKPILGNQLVNAEEASAELVRAVLGRIDELDAKDPALALALRRIIQNWKGPAINSLILKDLKNGRANVDAVLKLLANRKELRETQKDEVLELRDGSPAAVGISACLLEESGEYDMILAGDNVEAKTALLGCARLIRAELPVRKVAENLKHSNKTLILAAERYLEAEDSAAARAIVLAQHPNEAKILGAKNSFAAEGTFPLFNNDLRSLFVSVNPLFREMPPYLFYSDSGDLVKEDEKNLQKEVKENQKLLGVYSYDRNFVRIYNDKTVFSWTNDPARYQERELTLEEFEGFKNFLAGQRVDELRPFLSACGECQGKQLLMLGRQGGRRVFLRASQKPQFFVELEDLFANLRKPPARLRYRLEDKISGLEILWADERLLARNLWKNGEDFRLLIEDTPRGKEIEREIDDLQENYSVDEGLEEESEERILEAEKKYLKTVERKRYENFTWFRFDKDKLADPTIQPSSIEHIRPADNFTVNPAKYRWKTRTSTVEIRVDETGLYKISDGRLEKLRDGYYEMPLVTPNGRWAVATKYRNEESEESYGALLVRVNLLTGKEFKVKIESSPSYEAIAYLPALNKILIFAGYTDHESVESREGDFFLLDAETGLTQKVKREVRPLTQQTFRPLQTAGTVSKEEFWAAIPDAAKNETSVGLYNNKTLSFKSLLTIPEIFFDSMQMWVDERENKMYFVYEGQLLALPLPKKT